MKNYRFLLLGAVACCLSVAIAMPNVKKEARASGEVEVHDLSKEYPGATGEYAQVPNNGTDLWKFQALNLADFFQYGTLGADSTTGQLTTGTSNTTLQMYPMIRDGNQGAGVATVLYPGYDNTSVKNLDFLVQYPQSNSIAYTDAEIGTGYFTASNQYNRVFGGQSIHPGTNCATVISFVAPKAGDVYIKDTLRIDNLGSDGLKLAIYHQQATYTNLGYGVWGGVSVYSLYGATPIFPQKGVNISSNYGDGWATVPNTGRYSYATENFHVDVGDMITFIYAGGATINCDQTYTAPKVVYGTRPDASAYADLFLGTLKGENGVCKVSGGEVQTVLADLIEAWDELSVEYAMLAAADKLEFANGTADEGGSNVEQALALYDHIGKAYNTQLETSKLTNYNFIGRSAAQASIIRNPLFSNTSSNVAIILVVATSIALLGVATFIVFKKRKENK